MITDPLLSSNGTLHRTSMPSLRPMEKVVAQLKHEFIGLDNLIDRMAEPLSAWLMAPEWQMRPRLINLWGMTGTGKTSLVKRFIELLHLQHALCTISMAKEAPFSLLTDFLRKRELKDKNATPPIILLDEFQLAGHAGFFPRTDARTQEIGELFQWFDTGQWEVEMIQPPSPEAVAAEYARYKACLNAGVRTRGGYIVEGLEQFHSIYGDEHDYTILQFESRTVDDNGMIVMPWLVSNPLMNLIYFHEGVAEFEDYGRVQTRMGEMSDEAVDQWIQELMAKPLPAKQKNSADALVFVIGNLDEAFESDDYDEDDSPAYLHAHTNQVTISSIQQNLLKIFRKEWVARLGSEHFLFPSLHEADLRKFVALQLSALQEKIAERAGFAVEIDYSVANMIYEEGVQANMGVRMLQFAVQNILVAQIPRILWWVQEGKPTAHLQILGEQMALSLVKTDGQGVQTRHQIHLHLPRKAQRQKLDTSNMACVAVHESGHALLHVLLFKSYPLLMSCATLNNNKRGLVQTDAAVNALFTARGKFLQLVVRYGGYIAEEIVFGKDGHSTGSEEDLALATFTANKYVQQMGLGSFAYKVIDEEAESQTIKALRYNWRKADRETAELLQAAMEQARSLLSQHQQTLRLLAKELLRHKQMNQEEIRRFLEPLLGSATQDEPTWPDYDKLLHEPVGDKLSVDG